MVSSSYPLFIRETDSREVFDNTGKVYNVSKIVNAASGYKLDLAGYEGYSPVCHIILRLDIS
jgi:hypothetical protein